MANKKEKLSPAEKIAAYLSFLEKKPRGFLYNDEAPREEQLAEIRKKFAACQLCPLAKLGRAQVVFGVGNPHAKLMFVGEGPGRDEDKQGEPFVGRAGKLLTKIIEAMGLSRSDVYISNTVKCRPPENRTPLPEESETCINKILLHEIKIIQPAIICTLGATATKALLGPDTKISQIRGEFIPWKKSKIIPTYHPAYLLRNPDAKRFVWEDMKKVMAELT